MTRLLVLPLLLVLLLPPLLAPAPARADGRLVLAFYYAWWEMSDWGSGKMPFLPSQPYSGGDTATLRRHLDQATRARVDGLIVSWWGPGDRTDERLGKLLGAARGGPTRLAAYIEPSSGRLNTRAKMAAGLRQLLDGHARQPAFLRHDGRPVIFIWRPQDVARDPGQSAADAWRSILAEVDPDRRVHWSAEGDDLAWLDLFDGLHWFGAALWAADPGAANRTFKARVDAYNRQRGTNKTFTPGVAPGHDDTRLGRDRPVYVERQGGSYYRRSWEGAMAAGTDWIAIVSFNEWFEATQIEPSPAYGDLYLTLTREMVDAWKGPLLDGSPPAAFGRAWARADAPVAGRATVRGWLWGPTPFDDRTEQYAEAPGGARTVRYYEKARMEVTRLGGDPTAPGYVTNGLLVRELIGGEVQVGDAAFQRRRPAQVAVVGDAKARGAVTYADLAAIASWRGDNAAPDRSGQPIAERFVPGRGVRAEAVLAGYGVVGGSYDGGLGHTIAHPFWDFFNATGPVVEQPSGRLGSGLVTDWRADVGLPLMEPVWVTAAVDGTPRDVLLQCFERRCLTYTPANDPAWRVEMGNVGMHYHTWRYGG